MFYAHSLQDRPASEWEPLEKHLREVAELAASFASAFDAADWGRLAGLWHDLGKYRPEFQARLRGSAARVEHAGLGAALAASKHRSDGLPLAFAIAGHHAGLADLESSAPDAPSPLTRRLAENRPLLAGLLPSLPAEISAPALPPLPPPPPGTPRTAATRSFELWTRFLFSCLVDADYLATEAFYSPGSRAAALAGMDGLPALRQRLDAYLDGLAAALTPERRAAPVNRRRAEVLAACRAAAELSPGLFSLTVPTGGGKTLSAMAFALRHAEIHGLRRVVAAIPFTSIIEQNAAVYRTALGEANVLEHHSAFDALAAEKADREAEIRRRLAAENWDAPVVVTTNVQLFESLFSSTPSRCRKLHNLARSVILLDEAQTLPVEYLLPVLDALRDLAGRFGCTVVLMTATQPALARRDALPQGLAGVREIVPDPAALARGLARVHADWPDPDAPPRPYEEIAREIAAHEQVLAVVHRRADARRLAELLPEEHRFHLSALLCPAHRSEILAQVRAALRGGRPCRLVATQLIEAGVDVDFPVVYRCLGGLDSLAQAAGRCNREGRLPEMGRVVFFLAESSPPCGLPRKGLEEIRSLLREARSTGRTLDLDDPGLYQEYFQRLYHRCDLDPRGIQALRQGLRFHSVGRELRLIPDATTPVVVPWGAAAERLDALRRHGPDRLRLRALQPFVVNLYEKSVSQLKYAGALEEIVEGVFALAPPFHGIYDARYGLIVDEDGPRPDPAGLIV